ncbi:type II toxin-antitoxin system RelE/ParE family toxin [Sandarakinorhabdus sp.]|uniref:type II toxin-antitoxin system RelE/ParE family toxin n=1 Tax=Sandarakinorhabdus sp. TaxID=1916663 RepID=UPI003F7084FC
MPVRLRPAAEKDLLDIWRHVAADNPDAADRLLDRFDAALQMLADNPFAGSPRPELGQALRSFVVGRYVLFHAVVSDGIELVRVIHGARDIGALSFGD